MSKSRTLISLGLVICLLAAAPAPGTAKRWQFAARLWRSVKSTLGSAHWRQAEGLLEEFIKKFGSHENVPAAYLYLAQCRRNLKNPKGEAEAIDAIIRRFGGSAAWYAAYAHVLARQKSQKKYDEFLETLEQFLRKAKFLPLDFSTRAKASEGSMWFSGPGGRGWRAPGFDWIRGLSVAVSMENELLQIGDTPERMEKVFRLIAPTLRRYAPDQLPVNWQFGYVLLLKKAGRQEEAEKMFRTYAEAWGDDPRGMALWTLRAEHLQAAGDDKGADAAYGHLIKTYMGYSTLSVLLRPRLNLLYSKRRYHDFMSLAKQYLQTYPWGPDRKLVLGQWLSMLRTPAVNGDAEALADIMHVLDTYYGKDSLFKRQWLIALYIDMKKPDQAVKAARPYLDDNEWSKQTYQLLKTYTARCKQFQALVDEAERKYEIFAPHADPNSEPVKLLKELKGRIKDDQVRHMEEIGEKLISRHRKTHEAVQALSLLSNYYFKKVLAKPRDAWTNSMIRAYPRHPDSQKVLATHVQSMRASRQYRRMGAALDLLKHRFPTAKPAFSWFNYRLEAYAAVKDQEGRMAMIRRTYVARASRAHTGNFGAIQALAGFEIPALAEDPNSAQIGGYWMKQAEKFKGTRTELHCLWAAYNAYFTYPWGHRSRGRIVLQDKALDVLERLQTQTMDPEVRWNLEFADVNMFAQQRKVREALRRLKMKLKGVKKVRDARLRLSFPLLGYAIGHDKKVFKDGLDYARTLRRICFTKGDQDAIDAMVAEAWYHAGAKAKAMKFYMDRAARTPWPIRGYRWYKRAMRSAQQISPAAMKRIADRYIARIPRCQSVVPGILLHVASHALSKRDPIFPGLRTRLANRYPSSRSRGSLEDAYAKVKDKLRKK